MAYVDRSEPVPIEEVLGRKGSLGKRLNNFKYNGTTCTKCGVIGLYFRLEKGHISDGHGHYNLYGIDKKGKEVLMTRDHILPLSLGGPDEITNQRTMCMPCNSKRGNPLEFPLISACPI